MPQKQEYTSNQSIGETENAQVMLLSEALELHTDGELEDAIVIVIPDTGKARFMPAKPQKNDPSKSTKATFVIAEIGGSFAGEGIDFRQSQGDVKGLPLTVRMSIVAQPPHRDATTIAEALGKVVQLPEAESKVA